MDQLDDYVSKEDFNRLVIGVCFLGVVLFIFIVLTSIAICFLIIKLRELYRLSDDIENKVQYTTDIRSKGKRNGEIDSAIALSDSYFDDSGPAPVEATEPSPVMELVIVKETVSVYGRTPPIDQVMMTAQNFYKAQSESRSVEDCPAELVQILDKEWNQRLARSTVFKEDWMEGTPTSLLLQGSATSFKDMFSHSQGIFIHRRIGPDGGVLHVSGVRLKIPQGALSEVKLVTVGITWDERFRPTLSAKQSLLSPMVLCQPSDLVFEVPVTLSFPHAANKVLTDWDICIMKRDGDLHSDRQWTVADDERLVTETRIKLQLRHFTLYTCTGTSKPDVEAAKLVHVVAYAGKLSRNSFFKPRLYCINSYKDELQDVERLETKLDISSRMAETTDLLIKDNGSDVIVEMSKLSDKWNLAGDRKEVLPFELVWQACHPHCTFIIRPTTTSASDIMCEIHTYQSGNEHNFTKLKIAELVSAPSSPLSTEADPRTDLVNTLIILLDPQTEAGPSGDWRALAEKMGSDLARIRWLATKTESPTKVLLDKWFEDQKSLTELAKVMQSIGRPDAAGEIRNRIPLIPESSHI